MVKLSYKKILLGLLLIVSICIIFKFKNKFNKDDFNSYCVKHSYCSELKTKYRKLRKEYRTRYFALVPEIPFQIKGNNSKNLKTIIVSHYTLDNGYIKSVIKNHSAYAKLHGYDYWFRNGIIDGNFLNLNKPGEVKGSVYALFWQKLAAVQQAMNIMEGDQPKYEWIMWIDGDAVFTNFNQSIDQLRVQIGLEEQDYFVIARDMSCNEDKLCFVKTCLNSGVFLIKNNQEGRNFIKKIIDSFDIYYNHDFPEQIAMEDLIFEIFTPAQIFKIENKYSNRCTLPSIVGVKIVNSRVMNSGYNSKNSFGCWKKGDFIAHFAGTKNRDKLIPKFLECINNNSENLDVCDSR